MHKSNLWCMLPAMVKKALILRASAALAAAVFAVIVGLHFFPEEVGGRAYDRLMTLRPPRSAPGNLLLVDSGGNGGRDGTVEPGSLARALLAMTELEAAYVVVQVPIALRDENKPGADKYLERRFDEEFNRIKGNIRTLFEGIRMGSIRPRDAERFVAELGALVDASKRRLLSAGVDKGDEGGRLLEQAAGALGRVRAAEDLRGAGLIRSPSTARSTAVRGARQDAQAADFNLPVTTHSRAERDNDGALRRLQPLLRRPGLVSEHVAYAALLDFEAGRDFGIDPETPLILEAPREQNAAYPFRKIDLADFGRYEELELKFYADLKEMERSGYFAALDPLSYPTTLYEYALSLRAELLIAPTAELTEDWREGRRRFYAAAEAFLAGSSLKAILSGYEALAEQEKLSDEGLAGLAGLKEIAAQSFEWARSSLQELASLRHALDAQVRGSFIIVGPLLSEDRRRIRAENDLGDTEASAVLVSTLLSDTRIAGASAQLRRGAALYPAIAAVLVSAILSPAAAAVACAAAAALAAAAAALLFLRWDIWLHPALPALGIMAAGAASVAASLALDALRRQTQLRAFAGRLRPEALSRRAAAGDDIRRPRIARAAVLAIRRQDPADHSPADTSPPDLLAAAAAARRFREDAAAVLRDAGAALLRTEGDLVFAAFGSPLDAGEGAEAGEAALAACRAAFDFLERADSGAPEADYRIGMDLGDCVFEHTPLGGYWAHGQAPINARLFSTLGSRYGSRIVAGKALMDALEGKLQGVYLDALVEKGSREERPFYGLIAPPPA